MIHRLPTYRSFGRRSLVKRFRVLLTEINHVRTEQDADSIHDMRVASRRFHAAAQIFADCLPAPILLESERHVRRIRKSAGAVRDCDVQRIFVERLLKKSIPQRSRSGLQRLTVRLAQKREKQLEAIFAAIDRFEKSGIAGKVNRSLAATARRRRVPLTLRQRAAREIVVRLSSLLSFEQFVRQSTAAAELHQMRISAKRLRYVMEIFNPVFRSRLKPYIKVVRSIQDSLGEMHDCSVWLQSLPRFLEKERERTAKFFGDASPFSTIEIGILYFSEAAGMEQMRQYRAFTRIWKETEQRQTWKKLTDLITTS